MIILKLFLYLILIFVNTLNITLAQVEYCDSDHDEALSHWYTQVYNSTKTIQNISEHLHKIDEKFSEKLNKIELELEKCQREILSQQDSGKHEIVIQRRQDGSENFERTWEEYKQGFGNTSGEFFLGLEKLHKLTNSRPYQLLIVMEDWDNERRYAKYDHFVIDSEKEKYKLSSLGVYSGTAGDSLTYHLNFKFTTQDRDNDGNPDDNCASQYKGAWWHNKCHLSNLNGLYLNGPISGPHWAQGVVWQTYKDYTYSLKFVEMILIRT